MTRHADDVSRGLSVFYSLGLENQRGNYLHWSTTSTGIRYRRAVRCAAGRLAGELGVSTMVVKLRRPL